MVLFRTEKKHADWFNNQHILPLKALKSISKDTIVNISISQSKAWSVKDKLNHNSCDCNLCGWQAGPGDSNPEWGGAQTEIRDDKAILGHMERIVQGEICVLFYIIFFELRSTSNLYIYWR